MSEAIPAIAKTDSVTFADIVDVGSVAYAAVFQNLDTVSKNIEREAFLYQKRYKYIALMNEHQKAINTALMNSKDGGFQVSKELQGMRDVAFSIFEDSQKLRAKAATMVDEINGQPSKEKQALLDEADELVSYAKAVGAVVAKKSEKGEAKKEGEENKEVVYVKNTEKEYSKKQADLLTENIKSTIQNFGKQNELVNQKIIQFNYTHNQIIQGLNNMIKRQDDVLRKFIQGINR